MKVKRHYALGLWRRTNKWIPLSMTRINDSISNYLQNVNRGNRAKTSTILVWNKNVWLGPMTYPCITPLFKVFNIATKKQTAQNGRGNVKECLGIALVLRCFLKDRREVRQSLLIVTNRFLLVFCGLHASHTTPSLCIFYRNLRVCNSKRQCWHRTRAAESRAETTCTNKNRSFCCTWNYPGKFVCLFVFLFVFMTDLLRVCLSVSLSNQFGHIT